LLVEMDSPECWMELGKPTDRERSAMEEPAMMARV
jgi:hypothetical protein